MCKVTNTLKLCTCNKPAETQRNYWTYNRVVEGKEQMIVGEYHLPSELELSISINNKKQISKMLNKGNCFDFEIQPIEDDHLYIHFNTENDDEGYSDGVYYSFRFKNGKWNSFETEPLMDYVYHDRYKEGVVKNGLTKNIERGDLRKTWF